MRCPAEEAEVPRPDDSVPYGGDGTKGSSVGEGCAHWGERSEDSGGRKHFAEQSRRRGCPVGRAHWICVQEEMFEELEGSGGRRTGMSQVIGSARISPSGLIFLVASLKITVWTQAAGPSLLRAYAPLC